MRFYKVFLVIPFFILLLGGQIFAQAYCHYCGGEIKGTYYREGVKNICPYCHDTRKVRCSSCGQSITGEYIKTDNQVLCINCSDRIKHFCNGCGTTLNKTYYHPNRRSDLKYCENCYNNGTMAKDVKNGYPVRTAEDFHLVGTTCAVCTRQLTVSDKYSRISRQAFCRDCEVKYEPCKSCAIPISPRTENADKNFLLCMVCQLTSIKETDQIPELFQSVQNDLTQKLKISVSVRPESIILVDHLTLKQHIKQTTEDGIVCAATVKHSKSYKIYLQKGMPYNMAYEVLSCQFAKIWRMENGAKNQEEKLAQAFENWVAWKLMNGTELSGRADALLESSMRYGLYRMIGLEGTQGAQGVIQYVRSNKTLP